LAAGLLSQIAVASGGGVPHAGERRVEFHWNDADGVPQSLAYRELVEVDGLGGFDLTPLEVLALDAGSAGEFLVTQKARAAFAIRYRDFAIRDLDLFLANYQLQSIGAVEHVAGRDGLLFTVARLADGGTTHELVADLETGLILRAREYAPGGQLVSVLEYESIDLGAPAGFVPFASPFTETPLATELVPGQIAALDVGLPKWLPAGYELAEASRLELGERAWTKLVYTDGLDPLFLLAGDSLDMEPDFGVPLLGAVADDESISEVPVLQRLPVGELTALRLVGAELDVLAVGSVPSDDLQLFLESALP
ncbi:MAG TPA: hypothetical protein VJP77_05350, partial [Planctomycetota bacterium]|nr:hypothetical protein [Planctomycetota bacterium]